MRRDISFIATLWVCLLLTWLGSGEQFLDLMFAMPNAGAVDDVILNGVVRMEEARAELGLPDLFRMLRDSLHGLTGLG